MATYNLRDLLVTDNPITVGGLVLSDFRNHSHVPARDILIDTVEGSETGINVRLSDRLSDTDTGKDIGFTFTVVASSPTIAGAHMDLSGFGFLAPETGGTASASLREGRQVDDRLGIDLVLDNAPGAPDVLSGSSSIRGGPLQSFDFDYDMAHTGPGHIGVTEIRFDSGQATLPPGFDGLQYIASYPDLIAAFGADRAAGEAHYLAAGRLEGRAPDLFNDTQYLKNYTDLQAVFGSNVQQATIHFITSGFAEGRRHDVSSLAKIDGLQYIASHGDLIAAFGADADAGKQHYATAGRGEHRALDTFDETQYLANYADLRAAFGNDTTAATIHYIEHGFAEGRNDFLI